MNLYRLTVGHAAPKDWCETIVGYVLASNDEAVYEYIKSEPLVKGHHIINSWEDKEEENEEFELYDDKCNVIGKETFKQKIIRLKGEMYDDGYDFGDSYYGITLYGWELAKENVTSYDQLLALGVAIELPELEKQPTP